MDAKMELSRGQTSAITASRATLQHTHTPPQYTKREKGQQTKRENSENQWHKVARTQMHTHTLKMYRRKEESTTRQQGPPPTNNRVAHDVAGCSFRA